MSKTKKGINLFFRTRGSFKTRCFVRYVFWGKESSETCLDQNFEGHIVEMAEEVARLTLLADLEKALKKWKNTFFSLKRSLVVHRGDQRAGTGWGLTVRAR